MNYELALQLKNAGFPQDPVEIKDGLHGYAKSIQNGNDYLTPEGKVYEPTLSELIEACGSSRKGDLHDENMEGTFILEYFDNHGWHAGYRGIDDGDMVYMLLPNDSLHFKTPIEAVANLWLSVNRK